MQSTTRALNAAAATPEITPQRTTPAAESPPSQQRKSPVSAAAAAAAVATAAGRKRVVADFEFGRTLGEGSYSTVVEAREKATGKVFAAKILDKRHIIKEKKIKYVNIERDVLHNLHHPFIVRLHYAFQDAHSLYFIIDIASNGELLSWIRRLGALSDECVRFYLAELVVAVEYMHMEHTLPPRHKAENILLGNDMHILVTGLLARPRCLARTRPTCARTRSSALQSTCRRKLLTDKAADRNSDLWAIGCIAFQLLTGRP
ncbi:kinase-like protein, partial [Linderina pennispora]